jgi:hypothetical protein
MEHLKIENSSFSQFEAKKNIFIDSSIEQFLNEKSASRIFYFGII